MPLTTGLMFDMIFISIIVDMRHILEIEKEADDKWTTSGDHGSVLLLLL